MKDDDKSSFTKKEEKRRIKEQCKLEKRRLKEEKMKKISEEKKKKKTKTYLLIADQSTLENFVQSENNVIPLLLEKCVKFIELVGLESEGLYRVPGNRSHVDFLFQKFNDG